MRQRSLSVCGLVIATLLACVPSAHAQTVAAGPYYATPSWDQKLQCDTVSTCPRFVVLSNWNKEAVLDRETGLIWQQNPSSTVVNWGLAMQSFFDGCFVATNGDRRGWRMPTIEELLTLDAGFGELPAGHPFGANASAIFWSATSSQLLPNGAMVWTFGSPGGRIFGADSKAAAHAVWCVRSPAPGFIGQ
jgi:Protein of unknown function (DUF1566)